MQDGEAKGYRFAGRQVQYSGTAPPLANATSGASIPAIHQ